MNRLLHTPTLSLYHYITSCPRFVLHDLIISTCFCGLRRFSDVFQSKHYKGVLGQKRNNSSAIKELQRISLTFFGTSGCCSSHFIRSGPVQSAVAGIKLLRPPVHHSFAFAINNLPTFATSLQLRNTRHLLYLRPILEFLLPTTIIETKN